MKAPPQPNIGNRVTFSRDGKEITARVQSIVTPGETVATVTSGGITYEVRNGEIVRLVTNDGIWGKREDGSYRFSPFCKRERWWW